MSEPTSPRLETRAARPYVAIPIRVTLRQWGRANVLVPEVLGWLERRRLAAAGPPFFRYHLIGDHERPFELEVGVPLEAAVEGDGRVVAGERPAGRYAVVVHRGHPDRLADAHRALCAWALHEGLEPHRALRDGQELWLGCFESYLTDPDLHPDPQDWATEIAYLVR